MTWAMGEGAGGEDSGAPFTERSGPVSKRIARSARGAQLKGAPERMRGGGASAARARLGARARDPLTPASERPATLGFGSRGGQRNAAALVERRQQERALEQRVEEHGSVSAHALAALLDAEPAALLRRARGRETFVHVSTPGARPWIVKRARESDLGKFVGLVRRSLGEREHANLTGLAADGLPVPRALGWTARRTGAAVCSLVVMELVEHAETLRERLARADARERARWSERLGALVTALHARGWYHRDLYLQHFVVCTGAERTGELALLDVARAEQELAPRERWFVKDLAALLHSTPRVVGVRERLRFVARYLDARGIVERDARRAFIARVVAKERRMAAHVPRAGEERPWTDR